MEQKNEQVTLQVEKDRWGFRKEYLLSAIESGLIELTILDKTNSSK